MQVKKNKFLVEQNVYEKICGLCHKTGDLLDIVYGNNMIADMARLKEEE